MLHCPDPHNSEFADRCARTCRASTDTAQHKAQLAWCEFSGALRIQFGQDLWCPFKGFGCYPWWPWQVLQVLQVVLLHLFQVIFTHVTPLSWQTCLSISAFHSLLCVYKYIHINKVYEHMCLSVYFKQFFFAQSNAHTTIMQESPSICRQAPSPVSIRLWSKSLLVLIWDKGALSLFSWRVAMATWHKDISIAG